MTPCPRCSMFAATRYGDRVQCDACGAERPFDGAFVSSGVPDECPLEGENDWRCADLRRRLAANQRLAQNRRDQLRLRLRARDRGPRARLLIDELELGLAKATARATAALAELVARGEIEPNVEGRMDPR